MNYTKQNEKKRWSHKNRKNMRRDGAAQDDSLLNADVKIREAIRIHKLNMPECPFCRQPISELASALADKHSGEPVHFDCVLQRLQNQENIGPNQKIIYIGQGRFALAVFENPHDLRKLSILKIIDWEERDKKYEWRSQIAALYSQVK